MGSLFRTPENFASRPPSGYKAVTARPTICPHKFWFSLSSLSPKRERVRKGVLIFSFQKLGFDLHCNHTLVSFHPCNF